MQKYVAVTLLLAFYCAIRDTIRDFACSITSGVASVACQVGRAIRRSHQALVLDSHSRTHPLLATKVLQLQQLQLELCFDFQNRDAHQQILKKLQHCCNFLLRLLDFSEFGTDKPKNNGYRGIAAGSNS